MLHNFIYVDYMSITNGMGGSRGVLLYRGRLQDGLIFRRYRVGIYLQPLNPRKNVVVKCFPSAMTSIHWVLGFKKNCMRVVQGDITNTINAGNTILVNYKSTNRLFFDSPRAQHLFSLFYLIVVGQKCKYKLYYIHL